MVKSSSVGAPEPEKLQKNQIGSNNMGHLDIHIVLQLCFSLSILVITHLGILEGSRYIHILLYSLFNSIFQWNINIVIKDYSDHVVTTAQHLPNQSSVLMRI